MVELVSRSRRKMDGDSSGLTRCIKRIRSVLIHIDIGDEQIWYVLPQARAMVRPRHHVAYHSVARAESTACLTTEFL